MFPLMGKMKALSTRIGYETAHQETVETDNWRTLPWEKYQRNVRRLQQRIYRAAQSGTDDNSSISEEPCDGKLSCTVRDWQGDGRPSS